MDIIPDKAAETYARLKAALLRANVPSGTFLNIKTIAGQMKVSPTPVREALIRLADDELIGFAANRGYYIKHVHLDDLKAEYEMAYMVTRYAVEKSSTDFGNIRQGSKTGMPGSGDRGLNMPGSEAEIETMAAYLEDLYQQLAMLSGNARMVRAVRLFIDRTAQIRRLGLMIEPKFITYLLQMKVLETRLLAGDREEALRLLEDQYHAKEIVLGNVVRELGIRSRVTEADLSGLFG
ncbi:GntR family transcriptional regulator [Neorhizobium alkalisoli]|uniref:DNA-binding GntR family transcriptional regulator n=1 Tax=Neorhizobium alkalisoli TaxID=528178 RepID=A0A561PZA1_9HYPH|nr:GntR family transcriptional regulator [Neorhizobium alkalisoli]TWF43438.1 DNA-binding GntR family transcriptional regulator [Neorhizobium alkalisoli]